MSVQTPNYLLSLKNYSNVLSILVIKSSQSIMLVPCQRFQNIFYLIWSNPGAGYAGSVTLFVMLVYLRNWHCLHLRHVRITDTDLVQKVMINSVMNFWKPSMLLLWYFISKNHDVILLKTIEFLLTKFSIIVSKFWWRQCLCDPSHPCFVTTHIFIKLILSGDLQPNFLPYQMKYILGLML